MVFSTVVVGLLAVTSLATPTLIQTTPEEPIRLSIEDRKAILLQMQELAQEQQKELEEAKKQNEAITQALDKAKLEHQTAQVQADILQKKVQAITDWGNEQALLKDIALRETDKWRLKHAEAVNKLWRWRLVAGIATVFLLGFIYLKVKGLVPF